MNQFVYVIDLYSIRQMGNKQAVSLFYIRFDFKFTVDPRNNPFFGHYSVGSSVLRVFHRSNYNIRVGQQLPSTVFYHIAR